MTNKIKLFVLPGMLGRDIKFDQFCRTISVHFNLVVMHHEDADAVLGLAPAGRRMAKRILKLHSCGPIYILGYSYGANIAFEASQHLNENGFKDSVLVMVDPPLADTEFDLFKAADPGRRFKKYGALFLRAHFLKFRLPWLVSDFIYSTKLKKRIKRHLWYISRYYARRHWKPERLSTRGLIATSSQFGPSTELLFKELCPNMEQVRFNCNHLDIMSNENGIKLSKVIVGYLLRFAPDSC